MRIEFADDGSVRVRTGKVELGQGIHTALTQIAADALGLPPQQVQVVPLDTGFGPDEGVTSGSLSIQDGGSALRLACLAAVAERKARADTSLDSPGLHESEDAGTAGLAAVAVEDCGTQLAPSAAEQSAAAPTGCVGRRFDRLDLPAKFSGAPAYIHDLAPPGMLHGRVLHPPQPDGRLAAVDLDAARALPGVLRVHRDGQLVGVLAERSRDADRAVVQLLETLRWEPGRAWPEADAALAGLSRAPARTHLVGESGTRPAHGVARTLRASYRKPWIAHASLAPSCALACWSDDTGPERLRVWTHSQSLFNLRRDLELAFGLSEGSVRLQHVEGAGCYGHNGADDVVFDAAWLARLVPGRTVRLLWSRSDELSRAPFGPGMEVLLEADLDDGGEVLHWRHQLWSTGHSGRPGRSPTPALLGSWQVAEPFAPPVSINMPLATGGGAERNAIPGYGWPAWQVHRHDVEAVLPRSSALRSLGAFCNVFAIESFVDEIAAATGVDPLDFRRSRLGHDPRLLRVLDAAAERAGWAGRQHRDSYGWGLGCARYKGTGAWCAVVAEVEAGAQLRVLRLTIAIDVGQVVNPDGVVSQVEGGAIQATSWALKEAVRFGPGGVQSDSWGAYPILRFSEVPAVDVLLMPSTEASVGAGEASLGPTAGAIGNALFDALGLRVRELPLTPERIVAAMDDGP